MQVQFLLSLVELLVLKGIIGYLDYSFEMVIFESFETNQIFVSF